MRTVKPIIILIFWAVCLGMAGRGLAQTPISLADLSVVDGSSVKISYSRVMFDRRARQSSMTATLTNISSNTIPGPLYLVIDNITVANVTVANAQGTSTEGANLIS